MVQSVLLGGMVLLSVLLIISLIRKPIEGKVKNPCKFKILPPKYRVEGTKKYASFYIIVEKKHRYFINVPFGFKFFSKNPFKIDVKIFYSVPDEPRELILDQPVKFNPLIKDESVHFITYITNVITGRILMEIEMEVDEGAPEVEFEIRENSVCKLLKEQKLKLEFPQ
jgi:hypothetical protein